MPRRSVPPRADVSYLHVKQIEAEADLLIAKYGERFDPVDAPPVPVDEMAEPLLHLTLEYLDMRSLFPYADVHGAIWFQEARIGIELSLDPDTNPSRRGRYHFTLAHEVGHWRLHREHYRRNPAERKLFDDGRPHPDVVCRSSERKKPVEWQADYFAACLLMPRPLIYEAWGTFRDGDDGPVSIGELRGQFEATHGRRSVEQKTKDNAIKGEFCRPLAEQFEVSPEAMRIRLEELQLLVAHKLPSLFE